MPWLDERADEVIADNLFAQRERWGWQYIEPAPPRLSPKIHSSPTFKPRNPPPTKPSERVSVRGLATAGAVVFIGLCAGAVPIIVVGLVAAAVVVYLPFSKNASEASIHKEHRDGERRRQQAHAAALARWRQEVATWDQRERERQAATDLWFPVVLPAKPSRVDVFGGTPEGWSTLLTTVGASLLGDGHSIFVVDFTEEDVAGSLCGFAGLRDYPVTQCTIPAELEAAGLLDGLSTDEIAEILSEAVDTARREPGDIQLLMLDTELIRTVVECLDGPVTFQRLIAGLLVLQRSYDHGTDDRLSDQELLAVSQRIEQVMTTELAKSEVQFVRNMLTMLVPSVVERQSPVRSELGFIWPERGVSVLRSVDSNRRRRQLVDRLVAHVLRHRVRSGSRGNDGCVVVIAGADHLGQETLEVLAQRCRRSGLRLLLLMEHLRGDLEQLVGTSEKLSR